MIKIYKSNHISILQTSVEKGYKKHILEACYNTESKVSGFNLEKWTVKTGQAQDVVGGEKERISSSLEETL